MELLKLILLSLLTFSLCFCAQVEILVALPTTAPISALPQSLSPLFPLTLTQPSNPTLLAKGTQTVYLIWYGNNINSSQENLLSYFINNLDKTSWFNILKQEYSPTVKLRYGSSITPKHFKRPNSYLGSTLTLDLIYQIIEDALISKAVPADPNGIYLVLGSERTFQYSGPSLNNALFHCADYCSLHFARPFPSSPTSIGRTGNYRGAYIGHPQRCLLFCSPLVNILHSPNKDVVGDAWANLIAGQVAAIITDPEPFTGFYDELSLAEAPDLCAWKYGTTEKVDSGANWNVQVGGKRFLLQQNWVKSRSICATSLATSSQN